MALLANIKINGIPVQNAYIGINNTRTQKQYQEQEDGSITTSYITWVHIGGAVDKAAWESGDRFNLNHSIALDGELTRDQIYPALKQYNIQQFELDLTQAIDV